MEFDKSRVYTALNADELEVGSKIICANTIGNLKELVEQNMTELSDLTRISNVYSDRRFIVNEDTDRVDAYSFAYIISKPEEKKLKWTDLKLGDIIKCKTETRMVTGIDTSYESDEDGDVCHICAGGWWCTDKELEEWEKVE